MPPYIEIRTALDPVLTDVCGLVKSRVPYCRSLVLIGSRAAAGSLALSPVADYDLVAVVPSLMVPSALRRLRRIEAEVTSRRGAKVSLNPLATLRLRHPDGSLMLLKLGAEGVVVCGDDVLPLARRVQPQSVTPWWQLFFLASQARRLLAVAPGRPSRGDAPASEADLRYHAAKAVIGCAEVLALRSGRYISRPDELESHLTYAGQPQMAREVSRARLLLEGVDLPSGAEAWSWAREVLLDTVAKLAGATLGVTYTDRERFQKAFLRSGGPWTPLRDLQYSALALMGQRSLHPRVLLDRRGVAERVKLALFWLLEAHRPDQPPDEALVARARRVLQWAITLPNASRGDSDWEALLSAVERAYPYACVALGF